MRYITSRFRKFIISFIVIFIIFSVTFISVWTAKSSADISDRVFRLHILANSDCPFDQQLKLSVRNRILKDCGYLFDNAPSPALAALYAMDASRELCRIAKDEIRKQGFFYPVRVYVGKARFPAKKYGGITLPAGTYQAVNIEIGSASGKNWWCVLYPPLCLTEGSFEMSEDALKYLKENLSAKEFDMITHPEKIQVKMKFKIFEIFSQLHFD